MYSKFMHTNRQSALKDGWMDGWISSLGIPSLKGIIKHKIKIKICYFSCGSSLTSSSVNDFGPLNFLLSFYISRLLYIVSGFYVFTPEA
jgi:hypothetical protein